MYQSAFTSQELTDHYPVSTTPLLLKTIAQVDDLIQQGVISDNELRQLLPIIGAAMDPNVEKVTVGGATYTGTAGGVTRTYFAIPLYPLPTGSAANPRGVYLNQYPQNPPGGRLTQTNYISENDMVKNYVGGSAANPPTGHVVTDTQTELDQSNYVTLVAPVASASVIPNVLFEIYCEATTTAPSTLMRYLVATRVAPGATVIDGNQVARAYTLPAHTGFAVDKSGSTPVAIPGPRSFII
jgi:hypothetical protein